MKKQLIKYLIAGITAACLLAGCGKATEQPAVSQAAEQTESSEQADMSGSEESADAEETKQSEAEASEEVPATKPGKDLTSFNQYNYMISSSTLSTGNNLRIKAFLEKLRSGETVNVATLGGSITEGAGPTTMKDGYAYQFAARLADEYGNGSNVNLVNAGLSGTPSTLGALRYEKDVLDPLGTTPDLLIIEFAVNDYQEVTKGRALESLVYQALTDSEETAVILLFSVSESKFSEQDSMYPIGAHYGIPMVSMKNALITGGMKDAEYFADEYHPKKAGHEAMCDCLIKMLMVIDEEEPDEPLEIPEEPKRGREFTHMKMIYEDTENVTVERGSFSSKDNAVQNCFFTNGSSFPKNYMNDGKSGNDSLKMTLECTTLLLNYKTSNANTFGEADVYVDGKKVTTLNGYLGSAWNNCNVIVAFEDTKPGKHTLEVKMAPGSEGKKFTVLGVAYN